MLDASVCPEPPKRGRPPVGDGRATRVSVRVPDSLYDRLDDVAKREAVSVPELIRQLLARNFGAK